MKWYKLRRKAFEWKILHKIEWNQTKLKQYESQME